MLKVWKVLPTLVCIFGIAGIFSESERPVVAQERPRIPPPSANSGPPPKPDKKIKHLEEMTERAFKQDDLADASIYIETEQRIFITKPEKGRTEITEETLKTLIPSLSRKTEMVVILLGKPIMWFYSKKELNILMDRVEKYFLQAGYQKVMFHQAHCCYRPILRETEGKP